MPIFSILNGYYLKKKFGSKLLFEIRDIWPLTLEQLGNKSKNHPAVRFIGWFEKFGYRKADTIVSLLPYARKHIESVAGKAVNFRYIPNGIDPKEIEYEKIAIKKYGKGGTSSGQMLGNILGKVLGSKKKKSKKKDKK